MFLGGYMPLYPGVAAVHARTMMFDRPWFWNLELLDRRKKVTWMSGRTIQKLLC
jgi:hypothetical protein